MNELKLLGSEITEYKLSNPDKSILEKFEYKADNRINQVVGFQTDEFTSLCPMTGQPDYASIDIIYIPNKFGIESKSLKLYLFMYRNHGAFHEDCITKIAKDLIDIIDPYYIRVVGDFTKRGGIAIKPISEYTKNAYDKPKDLIEQYDNFRFKR